MAATFCSFCSREVSPSATECPWCGAAFHTETLSLLTDDFPDEPQEKPGSQRKFVRVPQSYKVAYFSRKELAENYLSDISLGGLFIATDDPLAQGETVTLKIFLPDKGRELEVLGEVAWSSRQHMVTPERTHPPGMGVKFLHLSIEDRIRIGTNILEC
jgi:type IV pilus assembly protein PilZ